MILVYHGGDCCGVRHIHGMGHGFGYNLPPKIKSPEFDARYPYVSQNLYTDEAPAETYEERLVRYIDHVKKGQLSGIIEVILMNYQRPGWHECLEKHGFKEVTAHRNSNSGNIIHIYHLCYGE